MTVRQIEYQEFLESDFWKKIRIECFRRDEWKCRYCGKGSSAKLQAHHTIYPDDWYQTTLDHLITLCRKCHKKEHGISITTKKKKKKKVKFHSKRKSFKQFEKIEIVDGASLQIARSLQQITREEYLRLAQIFVPIKNNPKPRKVKLRKWWVGMYEGVENPDLIKHSEPGNGFTVSRLHEPKMPALREQSKSQTRRRTTA